MKQAILILTLATSAFALSACNENDLPAGCRPGSLEEITRGETPRPGAPAKPAPREFTVNPDTLRDQLLENETSILLAANRVHRAKDELNVARAGLLPSINLSTLIFSASSPNFLVTGVDFLMPFLLPTKWIYAAEKKNLMEAEKIAFRLMKLNTYASAYSMYLTLLNDMELKSMMDREARDLQEIQDIVEATYNTGGGSPEDVSRARAQTLLAKINSSKVNDLITQERASIRHSLGLPTTTNIKFAQATVPVSSIENLPVDKALPRVLERAPEFAQIQYLMKAAELEKWKISFAFLAGATMRSAPAYNAPDGSVTRDSVAFSNMTGSATINLGLGDFFSFQLADRNVTELKLRAREVRLETAELLEVAFNLIREGVARQQLAAQAEIAAVEVYETLLFQYQMGSGSLIEALRARTLVTQAQTEVLRAKTQLALQRAMLHRLMVSDKFSEVQTCKAMGVKN